MVLEKISPINLKRESSILSEEGSGGTEESNDLSHTRKYTGIAAEILAWVSRAGGLSSVRLHWHVRRCG